MLLHYHKEITEFILKVIIACIAWIIIIFYNINSTGTTVTETEIYEKAIVTYKYHNSNTVQTTNINNTIITTMTWEKDILDNKTIIDSKRSTWDQEKIKTLVKDTILTIDKYLKTDRKIIDIIEYITINHIKWKSRGYATHSTITINYGDMSEEEFIQVLTHELWHIIDLWVIIWTSPLKTKKITEFKEVVFSEDDNSLWYYALSWDGESKRKINANKKDFCSVYGMSNPFEDIAECIQLYLNHNDYFFTIKNSSTILERKYNLINNIFWWKYRYNKFTTIKNSDKEYRYRDSTRL